MIKTEPQPPRARAKFKEAKLPKEPKSDVKITLDDGTVLRERMKKVESDHGYSLVLTNVRLDENDAVTTAPSPAHEVVFSGETLARLGSVEAIQNAIDVAREEAAALARDHFKGLEMGQQVIASRIED